MTNLLFGIVLLAASSGNGPATAQEFRPALEQVRMVCDQACNCWPTRSRERPWIPAGREDLVCPSSRPDRPPLGFYNGHYRIGPATGIGFESRYPVRELAFPF